MAQRICKVCQASYQYCPVCDEEPYWKMMFDDDNCRQIFNILQRHYLKEFNDTVAIAKLKECDLSQIDKFDPKLKQQLQDILAKEVKKPQFNKKPIVNKKQEID